MQNPKKDHTELICNIGELSGLFSDASSLENFLQKITDMISSHMHSEVCSIYIFYDETQELVLRATKGLNPDSIGKVKMKLGEGLTGLALRELRPICEKNASRNPHFKYFPGIGEETYESFLVVPIVRGQNRIGAMVIQNTKKNYFTEEDVKTLRAITSQLANTIETAKLLMTLNEKQAQKGQLPPQPGCKFVRGRVGSEGFAFAQALVVDSQKSTLFSEEAPFDRSYALDDFYKALRTTEKQLEDLQKQIEEQLSDVASLIFTAQILMLKDKGFTEAIVELIKQGVNAPVAVIRVAKRYVSMFDQIPNAYVREKSHDVEDIGRRLLANLTGKDSKLHDYRQRIVIARELFPSDILKLSSQEAKGIILLSGGVSSHLSILARSLKMPLIIIDDPQLLDVKPETKILLDAEVGNIYVDPGKEILEPFRAREKARADLHRLQDKMREETRTKDGTRVRLLVNINLLSDLKAACVFKCEGIGLYRTEFPFIVRSNFPTEEEQYVIYRRLVEQMSGKEITFRTLDIGGDKVLSYYSFEKEENPFLGMRSIRFSLRHKDIFSQQIRAILRAGVDADVRLMFPMISSLDEYLEARSVVYDCLNDLKKEKIPHKSDPAIGLMIELPAVLEIIDELTAEADFLSVGTNDFIQYMLAVDRTNEKVADLYLPYHPSVLRAMKRIVDSAVRHKKDISICGDMAHDERYLSFFLGIGVRRLSVDALYLPKLQALVAGIELKEAEKKSRLLLGKNKISETALLVDSQDTEA